MKKQFVPYDLALKLKELGFDEECLAYYRNPKLFQLFNLEKYKGVNQILTKTDYVKAPLWQQAFDWFVENRNVHVSIEVICRNRKQQYRAVIRKIANFGAYIESRHTFGGFNTREEAKEKALTYIIKNYHDFNL